MMTNFEIRERAREILKTNSLWLAIGLPLLVLNGISYYNNFASEGGSSLVYIISFIVSFWEVGVAGYVTNVLTGKRKLLIALENKSRLSLRILMAKMLLLIC